MNEPLHAMRGAKFPDHVANSRGLKNYFAPCSYIYVRDVMDNWMQFQYIKLDALTGIDVFPPVVMKTSIFWHITPCSPVKFNRHCEGIYYVHVKGWIISQAEDKGGTFLRKFVDFHLTTRRYIPEDVTFSDILIYFERIRQWRCTHISLCSNKTTLRT
jgi:hypothetical protein